MTLFWLLAAVLVVICMVFLLRPLMRATLHASDAPVPPSAVYRDHLRELDADLQRGTLDPALRVCAQDELGRRMLDDHAKPQAAPTSDADGGKRATKLAAMLLAIVPSAAIVLYLQVGNPLSLWRASDTGGMAQGEGRHEISNAQVEALVNQLAQRLRSQPEDAEGWYMLGRSYAAMERPADAAVAYGKAVALVPDEAMLRADYADVLASLEGGNLQGGAKVQIDRALELDPDQPKALALAATAALQREDKARAIAHWEHLYRLLPPQSQTATRVAASLAELRGEKAAPSVALASGAMVSGRVVLVNAPRKPGPDETVFIYARAVEGTRMPLAVLRRQVRDLPLAFTLDDSLAMTPEHRLSSQPQVMLEARISASANAISAPGDLIGTVGPVPLGSMGVVIEISSIKP